MTGKQYLVSEDFLRLALTGGLNKLSKKEAKIFIGKTRPVGKLDRDNLKQVFGEWGKDPLKFDDDLIDQICNLIPEQGEVIASGKIELSFKLEEFNVGGKDVYETLLKCQREDKRITILLGDKEWVYTEY